MGDEDALGLSPPFFHPAAASSVPSADRRIAEAAPGTRRCQVPGAVALFVVIAGTVLSLTAIGVLVAPVLVDTGPPHQGRRMSAVTDEGTRSDVRGSLCPICGELGVPIVFGLPTPAAREAAADGSFVLAGCLRPEQPPHWRCPGRHEHMALAAAGSDPCGCVPLPTVDVRR